MASEKASVHIGALAITLHIPASTTLKEKRRVLKSLKDRIRAKYNVSVAEIEYHDKWQHAVIGCSMISNDRKVIAAVFESILSLVATIDEVLITAQQVEYL